MTVTVTGGGGEIGYIIIILYIPGTSSESKRDILAYNTYVYIVQGVLRGSFFFWTCEYLFLEVLDGGEVEVIRFHNVAQFSWQLFPFPKTFFTIDNVLANNYSTICKI